MSRAEIVNMPFIDFSEIVKEAWQAYDSSREIKRIVDISAKVSTNHVYRITFTDGHIIIGKMSYFGIYEHFVEDHTIINSLSNNLHTPFDSFLARSLFKEEKLFVYRFKNEILNVWVVFYRPITIKKKLPRQLDNDQIIKLGEQIALLHKACFNIRNTLQHSSKTLKTDIDHLLGILETDEGKYEHRLQIDQIKQQCNLFLENSSRLNEPELDKIPIFVDWNIGNFSVTSSLKLYSRWDYDWFRIDNRVLDFYFLSRVVSSGGDRTVFSYGIGPMMEERFFLFLKSYHSVYPLKEAEIRFLKEAYRFFILNYVVKEGRFFFDKLFATRLQKEATEIYFPSIEKEFDADVILKALNI